MTNEEYERACLEATRKRLDEHAEDLQPRVIESVELAGSHPDTEIVVRHRDERTGETTTEGWLLWDALAHGDTPESVAVSVWSDLDAISS